MADPTVAGSGTWLDDPEARKRQNSRHPFRGLTTTCDSCGRRQAKAAMYRCEEEGVRFCYCDDCYQP